MARSPDIAWSGTVVWSGAAGVLLWLATLGTAQAETANERSLWGAAYDGRAGEVERLLADWTNPNVPDHSGRTAVHHAALKAHALILKLLLEAGGNPNVVDWDGFVPLHFAADFEFEPDSQAAIRVLLDHGADPDRSNNSGLTPLHLAARRHQSDLSILHLLDAGADPNRADSRGDTPLHYAVDRYSKFSPGVVAALVDRGADGSQVGAEGETPLQRFARVGTNSDRIVAALVDGGSDPNAKNPDGESPLHTTIRNGGNAEHPRAVEALLQLGADPCIKDAAGYIPYNTAREGGTVHGMLANAGGSDIGCQGSEALAVNGIDRCKELAEEIAAWLDPGVVFNNLDRATWFLEQNGVPASNIREYVGNCGPTSVGGDSTARQQDGSGAERAVDVEADTPAAVKPEEQFAATPRDETEVQTAATVEKEFANAPPDNSNGSADRQASNDAVPNCTNDTPDGAACWWQLEPRPECRIWNDSYRGPRRLTWTGTCSGGFGDGDGNLIQHFPPPPSGSGDLVLDSVGRLVEGKRQGHWVDARNYWSMEGEYVDGKRQGHWVEEGKTYDHFEGPYVDGMRHGHWRGRSTLGNFFVEGAFVDGKRSGLWIEYMTDSEYHAEIPYVEGKPHGQSSNRNSMGETYQQCFHHGEEIAC